MSDIKKLIQEEIKKFIEEQSSASGTIDNGRSKEQKDAAIQNVNQHIRFLKLLKSTVGQIKMPEEFEKMAGIVKEKGTAEFLQKFLQVKDDLPVKIEAVLTNPLGLIQTVIDEVINTALKNAKQKLQEADLPNLTRDYKSKHDKKTKKKGQYEVPPPKLEEKNETK